jgi:hypothetical protein
MRVLACGGRDYRNSLYINTALDIIHAGSPITLLINGGAKGADTLSAYWAFKKGIERRTFVANWGNYGRAAGAMRNRLMLVEGKPELVVAFPGGVGTANMIEQAISAGIPLIRLDGETYAALKPSEGNEGA